MGNSIEITYLSNGAADFQLFDLLGNLVTSETAFVSPHYLNITHLNSGYYVLRMRSGRSVQSHKVKLQK